MITLPPYISEIDCYFQLPPEHRWIFNKLEICERFGYKPYGPCSVSMPIGTYCIRPIINLNGMSTGGFWKKTITKDGIKIPKPGYVWTVWSDEPRSWCEYVNDKISSAEMQVSWNEATQMETYIEYPVKKCPPIPDELKGISRYMIVERLGDMIIDIGPRHIQSEGRQSIIEDYRNFDPDYNPTHVPIGFIQYTKRLLNRRTGSYSWDDLPDMIQPRKINK